MSSTAGNIEIVSATSDVARGKRRRDAVDVYDNGVPAADVMPPHRRVRGGPYNGNLEAARSGAGAHRTPDTRVPTNNNETSNEAGRRVEGLTTPNVQGVHHCSLLGPSFQQGWVVTTAQGHQLPGIEERVEEALHMTSTEQQNEGHLFEFSSDFEGFNILQHSRLQKPTRHAEQSTKSSVNCVLTVDSANGMISRATAGRQGVIHLKYPFASTVGTSLRTATPSGDTSDGLLLSAST